MACSRARPHCALGQDRPHIARPRQSAVMRTCARSCLTLALGRLLAYARMRRARGGMGGRGLLSHPAFASIMPPPWREDAGTSCSPPRRRPAQARKGTRTKAAEAHSACGQHTQCLGATAALAPAPRRPTASNSGSRCAARVARLQRLVPRRWLCRLCRSEHHHLSRCLHGEQPAGKSAQGRVEHARTSRAFPAGMLIVWLRTHVSRAVSPPNGLFAMLSSARAARRQDQQARNALTLA